LALWPAVDSGFILSYGDIVSATSIDIRIEALILRNSTPDDPHSLKTDKIYTVLNTIGENYTATTMHSSHRANMNAISEKDAMSMKSTSTMTSTKSLLKSMLATKRSPKTTKTTSKETPVEKSERKAIKAEATYYALR